MAVVYSCASASYGLPVRWPRTSSTRVAPRASRYREELTGAEDGRAAIAPIPGQLRGHHRRSNAPGNQRRHSPQRRLLVSEHAQFVLLAAALTPSRPTESAVAMSLPDLPVPDGTTADDSCRNPMGRPGYRLFAISGWWSLRAGRQLSRAVSRRFRTRRRVRRADAAMIR
jgi:hypothetical protein